MFNIRRCPECGQMSEWSGSWADRCQHCGELLAREEIREEMHREEQQQKIEESKILKIRPGDNTFIRILKTIGTVANAIFVGIISFILWILAMTPG